MNKSYSTFLPDFVIKNCDKTLDMIKQYRDILWKYEIEKKLTLGFRSLFGRKFFTKEECIERLKVDGEGICREISSTHNRTYECYCNLEFDVKSLRTLAEAAKLQEFENKLYLTAHDVSVNLYAHVRMKDKISDLKRQIEILAQKREGGMLSLPA